MKKTFITILIISLIMIIVGCSNDAGEVTDIDNESPNEVSKVEDEDQEEEIEEEIEDEYMEDIIVIEEGERTLEGLKTSFEKSGLEVGKREEIDYERLDAYDGMKFDVNGKDIEIYRYDLENLTENAKDIINQVITVKSIPVEGTNLPSEYHAEYHDGFLLAGYDLFTHPAKVLRIFAEYSISDEESPNEVSEIEIEEQEEPIEVEAEEEPTEREEGEKTLEGLKASFKDAGFKVGENQELDYERVNADNGMRFDLDGTPIEIYKYDLGNLSDEATNTIVQARTKSIAIDGSNYPAQYNEKGFMLLGHLDHKQGIDIIVTFQDY